MSRKQCAKCPWKVSTNPHDIPDGYDPKKHRALKSTIAQPASLAGLTSGTRAMACHESNVGAEVPCVGWLAHQLGPGNNIPLRLAAAYGKIDTDFELDGKQHGTFEETLPKRRRARAMMK